MWIGPHINMKIQLPHFRGGFGIMPNEGSAISAFYSATCALIVWRGSHVGALPAQQFADTWAPGQDLTSPEKWHVPILQALSKSHAFLLQDFGCVQQTAEPDRSSVPRAVTGPLPSSQPLPAKCWLSQSSPIAISFDACIFFGCSFRVLMRNVRVQKPRLSRVKGSRSHNSTPHTVKSLSLSCRCCRNNCSESAGLRPFTE